MIIKVMVVDDSKFIFEEIKRYLEGTDFEIIAYCKDGNSAIKTFSELRPDIVTMDIIMPNVDGFTAASEILKVDSSANIVFLSSLAYEDTIEQTQNLGAVDFLFKPLEKEKLIASFLKIVDSHLKKSES